MTGVRTLGVVWRWMIRRLSGVPTWPAWTYADQFGLGRYIQSNIRDLPRSMPTGNVGNNFRDEIKNIYDALTTASVRYELAPVHTEDWRTQRIRHPFEMLRNPGTGNCLDLSLLFGGICNTRRLQAVLIVGDVPDLGLHAFVVVCLHKARPIQIAERAENQDVQRIWDFFGGDASRPYNPVTTDPQFIIALNETTEPQPESGDAWFCPVECTGVTQNTAIPALSFCESRAQARKHISALAEQPGKFRFAIDISYHSDLGRHRYESPNRMAGIFAVMLLFPLFGIVVYLALAAILSWPVNWTPRLKHSDDIVFTNDNIKYASVAFDPCSGSGLSGDADESGRRMMKMWRMWTTQRQIKKGTDFLAVEMPKPFTLWYYSFQADVKVTYKPSEEDKYSCQARIKAIVAFLVKESPDAHNGNSYRQLFASGDFDNEISPWDKTVLSLLPANRGEKLLLMLEVWPLSNEVPLPTKPSDYQIVLSVKKEVP